MSSPATAAGMTEDREGPDQVRRLARRRRGRGDDAVDGRVAGLVDLGRRDAGHAAGGREPVLQLDQPGSVPRASPPALVSSCVSCFFSASACFCCLAAVAWSALRSASCAWRSAACAWSDAAWRWSAAPSASRVRFCASRAAAERARLSAFWASCRACSRRVGLARCCPRGLPAQRGGLGDQVALLGPRRGDLGAHGLGLLLERRDLGPRILQRHGIGDAGQAGLDLRDAGQDL